jgi:signal transduction histidine kinase
MAVSYVPPSRLAIWARVGGPIAGLIVLVTALGLWQFNNFAKEHDRTAHLAAIALVERSFATTLSEHSRYTSDFSIWDVGFQNTTLNWNARFVRENYYSEMIDAALIVSASGAIRHFWVHPRHAAQEPALRAAIQAILPKRLALRDFTAAERTIRNDRRLAGLYRGHPISAAIVPIRPETPALLTPAASARPADYFVSIKSLDAQDLSAFGAQAGLADFRFSPSRAMTDGRVSVPFHVAEDASLGYLYWLDARPGSTAFQARVWPIVLTLALLSLAAALLIAHSVNHSLAAAQVARSAAEAAQAAAERSNALKSQFVATMSHELRTPLNAIIGYAEIINEDAEIAAAPDIGQDASRILKAARHLLGLINELLDSAKVEAGELVLTPEPVSIAELIDAVASVAAPLARANDNELDIRVDDALGVVMADPLRLKQSLLNILGNALKFTKGGQVRLSAARRREGNREWVISEVSDTGIGMSDETQQRIFSPFVQADGSITRQFGGTGLGLSITKALIEAMGGNIRVVSALNKGSIFTIRMPFVRAPSLRVAA